MSAKHIIVFFLVQYVLFTHCQPDAKFFRKDYQYIGKTKSFYKFQTIPQTWEAAKERCEFEGASLFYPNDENEAMAVIDYWNTTQSFSWIFIGISTPNVKEVFETVDGLAIWQVYGKWERGQPNNLGGQQDCVVMRINGTLNDEECGKTFPYICKKTLNSLVWNMACDLPDQCYINEIPKSWILFDPHQDPHTKCFFVPQGRCYKFHLGPRTWEDAVTICNAEQSYLAVINSDEEAELLVYITNGQKDLVKDTDCMSGAVHLGFKFDSRWRTLKGKSLSESGYRKWATGHPENKGEKNCGSMFYNGTLNDIACSQKCSFICEHEPEVLEPGYDIRFNDIN